MTNRVSISWVAAYAYAAYALIGDVPALSTYAAFSVTTSSLLFVLLYFFHSVLNLGAKRAALYFAVAGVLSYLLEFMAINTGVFGTYVYTADLSPFIGEIPLFIPLLWASLSYFCMLAVDNYLLGAVLMVLLDLSFDPRFALQLWRWVPAGPYFGVPLQNFGGWFITSLVIFGVYYALTRRKPRSSGFAILFYFLVGVSEVFADVNAGLYEAGTISIVLFAAASVLLYANLRRRPVAAAPVHGTAPGSSR